MELKHLKREVNIALEELQNFDCADCEYRAGCKVYKMIGVSFCEALESLDGIIDLLEKSKESEAK